MTNPTTEHPSPEAVEAAYDYVMNNVCTSDVSRLVDKLAPIIQAAIDKSRSRQTEQSFKQWWETVWTAPDYKPLSSAAAERIWNAALASRQTEHEDTARLRDLLRSVHTWFMRQSPEKYNGCGLWIDVHETLAESPRPNCILDCDSPSYPPHKEEYQQCGCERCLNHLAARAASSTEK